MAQQPTIESAMTPFPYSVEADAHASSARTIMTQLNIRHLPVREGETLVGVLSDWGLRRAAELGLDVSSGGEARVRDVCSKEVLAVAPEEPLANVLTLMAEKHVETVLVVRNGKLAGIFTVTDACKRYADLLRKPG